MVLESLMLLLALATPPKAPRLRLAPAPLLALAAPAAYKPHERAVGNWRFESALGLDLPPLGALKQFAGTVPAQTPRCVKLNNYWCIKRAGWNGEIASDPDGHVAFASAEEGASRRMGCSTRCGRAGWRRICPTARRGRGCAARRPRGRG